MMLRFALILHYVTDKKRDKPPRPPNCFMMYRSDKVKEINENRHQKDHMQKDLSKYVAGMYTAL